MARQHRRGGQLLGIRSRCQSFPIHERLREERISRKITQAVIAEKLGKLTSWVSRVERGEFVVPGDLIPAYAQALGLSVAQLYQEAEAPLAQAG